MIEGNDYSMILTDIISNDHYYSILVILFYCEEEEAIDNVNDIESSNVNETNVIIDHYRYWLMTMMTRNVTNDDQIQWKYVFIIEMCVIQYYYWY